MCQGEFRCSGLLPGPSTGKPTLCSLLSTAIRGLRNVRQRPLRGLGFCLDRQLRYRGCQPLSENTCGTDVVEGFPSFTKKAIKFYFYRNPGLSIVELVCF